MTTTRIVIETIGWSGMALILAAYILLSMGRMDGRSRAYQWINVVGAICFILNSGYNGAIPSATLNVAWAVIGLYTLWRVRQRTA
ncbi:hypothetical protein [Sphingomonas bacterium]|uniref:CBU_0592 family membrane protein n=1 Tax=Sphingomonas bacterium TaxID=1895847 RepID=UPI0026261C29|nr:hypothetical protein [Sphingomonas bacterium]MDB5679981.1 conserved rane protein of unknown function [Sphingomonas bacterium]